ncbi:PREDICTED: uncharacterized protein LOC109114927 [Nelumbo nucifera]|uniref:Uncharacterized protein LOC109114927 n=1 Tax=Nelumbo nucifera TaxID=4432 RepID=A0A1U8Q546_NELNU|nr:PREDICTED: uncharacterized protein LOC109114927 [Nelumbo nucifera]
MEQLSSRVHELEHRLVENHAEVREVKEDVRELRRLLELCFSTRERSPEGATTNNSRRPELVEGSGERQIATPTAAVIPKYSRLEFPSYSGSGDPLGWLYHYEQFFRNQRTEEKDKVSLVAFHMTDEAQLWFYRVEQEEPGLNWDQFKSYCLLRFGPPLTSNPLGELINLKQIGTVVEYQRQFQTLLARASLVRPDQQVDMFTARLAEPLRVDVEMQSPPNLVTAMNLARAFERKLQISRGSFSMGRSATSWANLKSTGGGSSLAASREQRLHTGNTSRSAPSIGSNMTAPPIKRLSRAEMAERRARGQCFNCDELYSAGHRCKRLFCLLVDELEEDEEEHTALEPEISLHAITGIHNSQTMQLRAQVAGKPVRILVDSGNTHNFISKQVALQLKLPVEGRPQLQVAVANGERVHSPGICRNIQIQVESEPFSADLFVLPLDEFDIVLGVKWLITLGPILWDFSALTMTFNLNGKQVTWQGTRVRAKRPQVHTLHGDAMHTAEMKRLLTDFPDVFSEPKGLPPVRSCGHRIPLTPGSEPVAVRPYRYPHLQKDEIARQCAEMLKQGIIRPSRSPFSSPVLLVPKQDSTWRFCVDYRELNNRTVKDKFSIPVVDELLDELHGSQYFSKLDLRLGYFQVRMAPEDVEKTAFQTHHGHFEFLVMPFGLTNAPSTFRSLMNEVFRPHLRKFVLVFFDDILVYSTSWVEHVRHLRTILELLRQHKLFLKRAKCSFRERQVLYLGHIISGKGVSVDGSKI